MLFIDTNHLCPIVLLFYFLCDLPYNVETSNKEDTPDSKKGVDQCERL
jgi:hypothetical protein